MNIKGIDKNKSSPVSPSYITYVIQPGDTLIKIAARYGTTYEKLTALNNLPYPDLICAGQTLRVPEDNM